MTKPRKKHGSPAARCAHDAKYRERLFKEICKHIASGYSIDCFFHLDHQTISKYLDIYPKEFVRVELEQAKRAGKRAWEDIGRAQSNGECLGNSKSWYYNMCNRYGWTDKVETKIDHAGQIAVQVINYTRSKESTDSREHT